MATPTQAFEVWIPHPSTHGFYLKGTFTNLQDARGEVENLDKFAVFRVEFATGERTQVWPPP
jgi:hypothetical protein